MKFNWEGIGLVILWIFFAYVIVWIINGCIWLYKKYENKKYEKEKAEENEWFKNNPNATRKDLDKFLNDEK